MDSENVLYLDVARFDEGRILRGGALVTDILTEPLEFRCTEPVRPTNLQKILWGARLSSALASRIATPLIRKLEQDYEIVVVRNTDILEIRDEIHHPIIQVTKHGELQFDAKDEGQADQPVASEPLQDSARDEHEGANDSPLLESGSGRFEPVVLSCRKGYESDRERARSILKPMFRSRDILEPFERIHRALEAVHEEEEQKDAIR